MAATEFGSTWPLYGMRVNRKMEGGASPSAIAYLSVDSRSLHHRRCVSFILFNAVGTGQRLSLACRFLLPENNGPEWT
jgi:hypothetical protein